LWRQRFNAHRLGGLGDTLRAGAPRKIGDDAIEHLIALTLETQPAGATHWSTRSMAKQVGMITARTFRGFRFSADVIL
jgi:hypothetical protein